MGLQSLDPGETRKLVSQPPPGYEAKVKVRNARVLFSHDAQPIVEHSEIVEPGDRFVLERLEGKPIYARGHPDNTGAATVELAQVGFGIRYLPRSIVGAVQAARSDEEAPAASDDWDEVTGDSVDIGSGGSTTETLNPPGRADQVAIHVRGSAAFEVDVTWNNTTETYSS